MIRTERLLLRQWREDDLEPWAALCADPVVMEHFPAVLSREQADASIARVQAHVSEHGYGLWAVEVDGELAGWTGLAWTDVTGTRELEVGWRYAHRSGPRAAARALRRPLEVQPALGLGRAGPAS